VSVACPASRHPQEIAMNEETLVQPIGEFTAARRYIIGGIALT
jgi:hypothetical protein